MKRFILSTTAATLACALAFSSGAFESMNSLNTNHSATAPTTPNNATNAELFVGHWQGQLKVSEQQKIGFVFNISHTDGELVATLDVPAQNQFGLPFDKVALAGNSLSLAMSAAGIQYKGQLIDGEIRGEYQQGGFKAPVVLSSTKTAKIRQAKPQDPSDNPNYQVELVTFKNNKEEHTLSGTITLPNGKVNHTAIILSGSGPTQRDGEVFGHKVYAVLADLLTKQGIAVLRFDDRGVGKSGGDFASATSADFASDANAALAFLRKQHRLGDTKIGFIGHSEGSLIASIAIADAAAPKSDFFVSLAGPGTSGAQLLIDQSYIIQKMRGMDAEALAQDDRQQRRLMSAIANGASNNEVRQILVEAGTPQEQLEPKLAQLTSDWMRYFIQTDPKHFLRKISVPVLAINGDKDLQVVAKQNIGGFIQAVDKQLLTYRIYPDLNHLLQPADKGLPSEYAKIETTLSPNVVKDIHNWLIQL